MIDNMRDTRSNELTIEQDVLILRPPIPGFSALALLPHLETLDESEKSAARDQLPTWLLRTGCVAEVDFFCSFHVREIITYTLQ